MSRATCELFQHAPGNSHVDCLKCMLEDSSMSCHDREMWETAHCNQSVHLKTGPQLLCRCLHNTSVSLSTKTRTFFLLNNNIGGWQNIYFFVLQKRCSSNIKIFQDP